MKRIQTPCTLFFLGLGCIIFPSMATVPETITIQGTLEAPGGGPLIGTYTCVVRIWDAATGGNQLTHSEVPITLSHSGRFSLEVNLEDAFIPPEQAWYDLGVDTDQDGIEEAEFFPNRVRFNSVPFARQSANSDSLGGQPASVFLTTQSLGLNTWSLNGNATTAGKFLGTTNNQAVVIKANNERALTLIPNTASPNLVGGHSSNAVGGGVEGGTISGGGAASAPNQVTGNYATIGGGMNNQAQGQHSTVAGGQGNQSLASLATVSGGDSNVATNEADTVSGGQGNRASGGGATIGGGAGNQASAQFATVGGGGLSDFGDPSSGNRVTGKYGTIAGGAGNQVEGDFSSITGGEKNNAVGGHSTISGGYKNETSGSHATVAGGNDNHATDGYASVTGGVSNRSEGFCSIIGGGFQNKAVGDYSTIPGGHSNESTGGYSFAAGRQAKANGNGSFVWGDSNDKDIFAHLDNQFVVRATGGFWFITAIDGSGNPTEGMRLPAGSSSWSPIGSSKTTDVAESANAVVELRKENAALKQRIENLENRLVALEELVSATLQKQ